MKAYITEQERKTDITKDTSVLVAGGGIAGIAAALAAARNGARVLLIEREYLLGGLATAGLITQYLPICDGEGRQVCYGIAEELLRLSVRHGSEGTTCEPWLRGGTLEQKRRHRFFVQYNPYVFAIEVEKLLIKNGVEILYGTSICDTVVEDGRIQYVIVENKSGRSAVRVRTVVDATGDADVCHLAGEDTVLFRQGNPLAAWYYFLSGGKNYLQPVGAADDPDVYKTEYVERFGGLDADELTKFTMHSHRILLEDFLKQGAVSAEHSLTAVSMIPQLRMTRRVDGRYTLDKTEAHKEFEDSVGLFPDWKRSGSVYELPFSCLCGKKISNLITAGRCISTTEAMWDITRVISVCAVSGEAAGTATAMTEDFSKIEMEKLQKRLRKQGVALHEKEL